MSGSRKDVLLSPFRSRVVAPARAIVPAPGGTLSGRSELADAAIDLRARAFAKAVIPYLLQTRQRMREHPTTYSRERLMIALEALRRGYILHEVEARPDIPFDIQNQVSIYTSGTAKSWSRIVPALQSTDANLLMSVLLTVADSIEDVKQYFEVREIGD